MKSNKIQERLIEELVRSVQMIEQNNAPEEKKDRDLEHVKKEYLGKIVDATLLTEKNIKATKFRLEGFHGLISESKHYNLSNYELHFDLDGNLIACYLSNEVIHTELPVKYIFQLESLIKDLYK